MMGGSGGRNLFGSHPEVMLMVVVEAVAGVVGVHEQGMLRVHVMICVCCLLATDDIVR